jgi:hypothetical protein
MLFNQLDCRFEESATPSCSASRVIARRMTFVWSIWSFSAIRFSCPICAVLIRKVIAFIWPMQRSYVRVDIALSYLSATFWISNAYQLGRVNPPKAALWRDRHVG